MLWGKAVELIQLCRHVRVNGGLWRCCSGRGKPSPTINVLYRAGGPILWNAVQSDGFDSEDRNYWRGGNVLLAGLSNARSCLRARCVSPAAFSACQTEVPTWPRIH